MNNLLVKNKLDAIYIKLIKLLELHDELKHILNENIIINEQILEEELFFGIEKNINKIQLEIDSLRNNINSSL